MRLKSFLNHILKFFAIVVFMIFFSSCSGGKEGELKKIRLAEVTRSVFYAPQYIALELGFFKEEGIDVSLFSAEGSDKVMVSLLANQCDIGLIGTSSVISVCAQGKENPPKLFSQLTQRDGSFLVGREECFNWEDLKGKTIIAGRKGSVPEMTFEYILKSKGIDTKKDVTLLNNIQFNLMPIAFGRGVGDYVCLFEPTASVLVKEKSCHILKPMGLECNKISYTGYCALPEYMNNNGDTIEAFVKSIYKAQVWVKSHSAKEISNVILKYFADASYEILEKCIENYISADIWCAEPTLKPKELDLMQEIMMEAEELDEKVEFSKITENKYALKCMEKGF